MKTVLLLALLVASPAAFAKTEVAGKNVSSGTGAPQYRTSRSLTVYSDGSVQIDVNNKGKRSTTKKKLSGADMKQLAACSKDAAKAKKLGSNSCAGGAYTGYMLGDTTIARVACGQKAAVKAACVTKAIKILDSL